MKRDGSFSTADTIDEYTLDESNLDKVGVVMRAATNLDLDEITVEEWKHKKITLAYTGTPTEYAIEKGLTGGVPFVKMLLFPCPTAVETIYYTYFRKPVPMSSGSDVADWPTTRVWLIQDALEYLLSAGKKDTAGYSLHNADFMSKVYKAMGDSRGSYLPIKVRPKYSNRNVRIRDTYWKVQS
jgi:hypothetical protein